MEPRIQYAKTSDGVSIAFWTMGEGAPLMYLPPVPQHAQLDWQLPHIRDFYDWLATRHRLIRFDRRKTGLSQRAVEDLSLGAHELDLETVADQLKLEEFSLFAHGVSGSVAVAFAAHHPNRVRRLILLDAVVLFQDVKPMPAVQVAMDALAVDWEAYTETVAGLIWGWAAGEETRQYAALLRDSLTQDDARRGLPVFDVSNLLPLVAASTLVVHHRDAIATTIETGRRLAAEIPDARFVTLEGRAVATGWTDPRMVAAVDTFLSEDETRQPAAPAQPAPTPGTIHTILFTDIVGHTEMMQRLGDDAGRAVLREHERITRETLKQHGGVEVKTDGDSFMASFASVSAAVECAVALQRAFAQYSKTTGEPIVVRMGLNVGEPIEEDGDYFGSAVILGARIKDQAGGGEILVPEAVRHLLSGKPFLFSDRGEVALKGFEDPVRLYEVRWREAGA